ncbi:MAG: hypothetical protein J5959_07380 [Butyrivibrio sp.]|nr:hypothetical protein [Butyrivibrio sp.]
MSLDFKIIRNALAEQFQEMTKENKTLYTVEVDKDELWELYLNTIPTEDNKIFRVRREFDCSCCRHFVKNIGNVVTIENNKMVSIWDFETSDARWNKVADEMSKYIKAHQVTDVYLSKEAHVGTAYNMDNKEIENPIKWEHFYVELPRCYVFKPGYRTTLDSKLGEYRDSKSVFKRSLDEFSLETIDTVLDLINQGSLYRGDEYKNRIVEFRNLKKSYDKVPTEEKNLFAWEKSVSLDPAVARIRNTAIGTLLIDIAADLDLEEAVRKYESVTAPQNYKRSKPIFTKRMLEDAQKTITDLGYLESLNRRYANADDITVNNILFSNRETASRIQNGTSNLFEQLEKETKGSPKKFDRVEEISIDKFINDVIPTSSEIEAYVEGKHIPNFVSLIAPCNKDAKTMFKWNNNFSWAYAGNVTDSMVKQNVKNAGGKVDGVLRFSIQWNDLGEYDGNDEDAHCIEPTGNEIMFSNCRKPGISNLGGQLDIDITHPTRNKPAVENITWPSLERMKDGVYKFFVHCYSCRGGRSGFRAEIEFNGQIYSFDYNKPLRQGEKVHVAEVTLKNGQFSIKELLPSNCSSKEVWGIKTNEFTPVSVVCYSPNYWDEQNGIGNKHYFFMLKNCVNPELPNAWYNEFLNNELYPQHRKVMEALSSKAHVQETDDQLSGIGFSSTLKNDLIVKVKGATERILRIKF